jgi:hypothetical protein
MIQQRYLYWGIIAMLAITHSYGASKAPQKIVVSEESKQAKPPIELLGRLMSYLTKDGYDMLCSTLVESIKIDKEDAQCLTPDMVTQLMAMALEHEKPCTLNALLEKSEESKRAGPLLIKLVNKITKDGYDALCSILLESIKADEQELQYLTKEIVTELMVLALEHNNITTFNALLRLENADPDAIDPITDHTLTYMTVQHNRPQSLALLAGPFHAKIEHTIKDYHVTPLYLAKTETGRCQQCAKILQAAGAKE